ncbi:sigma-E processing peptidase SpoIIGA [Fuchsiella alkaliacetigena]|uniref:sigma-E processing peptidase SpoIIGA n=1 Tax=Fuchsiella alkaliacetigena TaxID=957042 RepID=UPI00200A63A6|nr:sigma-E processing peptidase SpoIIGA [Fuchsiella alkaliacetigena]MCK8823665.1 sigma-E processing peptidase SpoIIGA [Fuchsiella alkaliacetigena]
MELIIYFDLLIVINLIMNYLILWTTGRLVKMDYQFWRLLLSAFFGTLYTILILLPVGQFLNNLLIYLLVSVVMLIIAYFPVSFKRLLKMIGYFYLIAFLAAGVLMAGYNLNLKSQFLKLTNTFELSLQDTWIFLFGILVLGLLGKFSWWLFQGQLRTEDYSISLIVDFEGRSLQLDALLDTGNQLSDPLTDVPVIIVELDSLLEVFPAQIEEIFIDYDLELEIENLATALSNTNWANRFRIIPFSSVGNPDGLLIGLRPDKVVLQLKEKKVEVERVILGVYNQHFDKSNDYTALINPELINLATET